METAFCTLVVFDTFEVLTIIRISCACVAFLYFRDYNSTNRLFYFLFCFVTITATMTTTMAMITEEIKTRAPFFESSPMLYDISQTLPSWDRVARGLIRLYEGEVLHKRVVVQHLKFTKYFNRKVIFTRLRISWVWQHSRRLLCRAVLYFSITKYFSWQTSR